MNIQDMNPFTQTLIEKLALLLFINSKNNKELKDSKNLILSCENYSKEKIITLLETAEYNYGFKTTEVEYTCCGVEITQVIRDNDRCPKCLENL